MLFNKQVDENRINEIANKLEYYPKQTNAWKLLKESGNSWLNIDSSKLETVDWEESWKELPQEELDYIKSLPEFDAEIFKSITGIDVTLEPEEMTVADICKELGRNIKVIK